MDLGYELQHIEAAARREWRQHPEIREEFRHDFEFYLEHRARRAGLQQETTRRGYRGAQ